jgi:hypothetical protein
VANVYENAQSERYSYHPFDIPFGDFRQRRIVLLSDEHVAIHVHQNVADIGAHFERLTEKRHEHDFVQLCDVGDAD